MLIKLKRLFFKLLGKSPLDMEMVNYWKTKEAVEAKVTELDGRTTMILRGEKYPFPGFPRGHILYGKLSKLKHEIKNQIFNESWRKLEEGKMDKLVATEIKRTLPKMYEIFEESKYDILPPHKMCVAVQEIHRAFTKVAPEHPQLRDMICHILQEDDSYRFRLQWIVQFMPTWLFRFVKPTPFFEKALVWLENGEVIGDMKERIRLFRRVMMTFLSDWGHEDKFNELFREIDWSKIKMSKADKYYFRGKFFKVDLDKFEY